MSTFKDLFSVQARDYSKYRPTYPAELFSYLTSLSQTHELAWDAGTGNGQAAVELAKTFNIVIATDPSEKQILEAVKKDNIVYRIEKAETPDLAAGSVNLITVAQAFHWLDHAKFADACSQVATAGCHLAVWTYGKAIVTPEIDAVVDRLYTGILETYWEKERKLVEEGYKSIVMPFQELVTPTFKLEMQWDVEQLTGYFKTWSALQSYLKKNDTPDIIAAALSDIEKSWGEKSRVRKVSWPLGLRVWKIK